MLGTPVTAQIKKSTVEVGEFPLAWRRQKSSKKQSDKNNSREFGISRCKLLYIGWLINRVLLYSTGNYIQHPEINHNRQEYEKEYIYIKPSNFSVHQKLIQHWK